MREAIHRFLIIRKFKMVGIKKQEDMRKITIPEELKRKKRLIKEKIKKENGRTD